MVDGTPDSSRTEILCLDPISWFHGAIPLMIHDTEEAKRFRRFIFKLMYVKRRNVSYVKGSQQNVLTIYRQQALAANADDGVRVQMLLQTGISARLYLEISQISLAFLAAFADQFKARHVTEGEFAGHLIGHRLSAPPGKIVVEDEMSENLLCLPGSREFTRSQQVSLAQHGFEG